jgi:hypothetical protein
MSSTVVGSRFLVAAHRALNGPAMRHPMRMKSPALMADVLGWLARLMERW